jgi:hypothetical protein
MEGGRPVFAVIGIYGVPLSEPIAERLRHEVIEAHARNVSLMGESRKKDDRRMRERWRVWRESIRS